MGIVCCAVNSSEVEELPMASSDFFIDCGSVLERSLYSQGVSENDFRVEESMGEGSYGKTSLAIHKSSGKPYAMKVVKKSLIHQPPLQLRPKRERVVVASRDCPFVVPVDYLFQCPDYLFIASEFQVGGNLASRLERHGKFTEDEARFYITEVAMGLDWFHGQQIVYGSLKPLNILLDSEGHVKLSELPICQEIGDTHGFEVWGDPDYTAPEILKGFHYSAAADYWSLGVVLYQLLNGKVPYSSAGCRDSRQLATSFGRSVLEKSSSLSQNLSDLLDKLLCIAPSSRLQTFKDLKAHPFFTDVNWESLSSKSQMPPFRPTSNRPSSLENFNIDLTSQLAPKIPMPAHTLEEKLAMRATSPLSTGLLSKMVVHIEFSRDLELRFSNQKR